MSFGCRLDVVCMCCGCVLDVVWMPFGYLSNPKNIQRTWIVRRIVRESFWIWTIQYLWIIHVYKYIVHIWNTYLFMLFFLLHSINPPFFFSRCCPPLVYPVVAKGRSFLVVVSGMTFTVLKGQNTTKSGTWLKVSSKMIPKMSLYKIQNLLGDHSRYPTISHKKMLCAKCQRVRYL